MADVLSIYLLKDCRERAEYKEGFIMSQVVIAYDEVQAREMADNFGGTEVVRKQDDNGVNDWVFFWKYLKNATCEFLGPRVEWSPHNGILCQEVWVAPALPKGSLSIKW